MALDGDGRTELIALLSKHTGFEGSQEVLPGLRLARSTTPTPRVTSVFKPSLCVVAQGEKEITIGKAVYRYDPDHYLVASVEMPISGQVTRASTDRPYLSIRLDLEPSLISTVFAEAVASVPSSQFQAKAAFVSRLEPFLFEVILRMMRVLDHQSDAPFLLHLIKKEVVYRLLTSEQGARLRHLPTMKNQWTQISKAVEKLRNDYEKPINIEGLALELGMSPSSFHHHFKSVMDVSPLQFQKLIRLQQARQLMLAENLDAASAGYRVGYDDPSHFSRDYKKQFGDSPLRDVSKARNLKAAELL